MSRKRNLIEVFLDVGDLDASETTNEHIGAQRPTSLGGPAAVTRLERRITCGSVRGCHVL
ncbi:MAG: hypothetical protein ABR881_27685 [Candidatus Sulfotelmatobacter sp.]